MKKIRMKMLMIWMRIKMAMDDNITMPCSYFCSNDKYDHDYLMMLDNRNALNRLFYH